MLDQNNDFTLAGPGAKRRRMRLEEIPREMGSPSKDKPKAYPRKPENAKQGTASRETLNVTERGIKWKIRTLTLQTETFGEVRDELRRANYPGSAVLVSAIRNEMREIVKLLIAEGVLDEKRLERYRREHRRARTR
jgi:hypothetical protein